MYFLNLKKKIQNIKSECTGEHCNCTPTPGGTWGNVMQSHIQHIETARSISDDYDFRIKPNFE